MKSIRFKKLLAGILACIFIATTLVGCVEQNAPALKATEDEYDETEGGKATEKDTEKSTEAGKSEGNDEQGKTEDGKDGDDD